MGLLAKAFFDRDPAVVARELLGATLVRQWRERRLRGRIVETEAYYGTDDPASRAFSGKVTALNAAMWEAPGTIMVYMVHANWLFNIVTQPRGVSSAVLIRAVEPLDNFDLLLTERRKRNPAVAARRDLCNGPGKFTQAFAIGRELNLQSLSKSTGIWVERGSAPQDVTESHRVGVTRDLRRKLRYYVSGNSFVSKPATVTPKGFA